MTKSDLPACPECGLAPEFNWREYASGACFGALKCPYNHVRVHIAFMAGHKPQTRDKLIDMWIQKINPPQPLNITMTIE